MDGNLVYIGHGEENDDGTQGSVVCLDAAKVEDGKPKLVWRVDGIKAKFASPVVHDGQLYVCNEVGRSLLPGRQDRRGDVDLRVRHGNQGLAGAGRRQNLHCRGRFQRSTSSSRTTTACTSSATCTSGRQDGVPVTIFGSPAILHGRVYFMTSDDLYCIGKKDHKAAPDAAAAGAEGDAGRGRRQAGAAPDRSRRRDCSTPGDTVDLKAYAFDEHGQPLGAVKVDWKLRADAPAGLPARHHAAAAAARPPPDLKGTARARAERRGNQADDRRPDAAAPVRPVEATLGDLKAHCRVRVAPKLPFTADFSKVPLGRTPAGWVNTQGKFSVIEGPKGVADHPILSKRNNNPNILVARANAYIGAPTLSDYTIEVDEYGTQGEDRHAGHGLSAIAATS